MKKVVNPELIVLARQMREYTQIVASELLNISQSKLSKIERGDMGADENDLMIISQKYDFPIEFFYNSDSYTPDGHLYFRRRISIPVKTTDAFIAKTRVLKMIVNRIMDAVELPIYNLGEYEVNVESPEDIARKVRYKLQIEKGRIPNITNILESNGIILFEFDFGTDKIDGLSSITSSGYKIIFLNKSMPEDRKRFSIAHELGHMLMHIEATPKYPETVEEEANRFASEFLMPKAEVSTDLRFLNFDKLADLKRKWHVSMRALVERAHQLNLISQQQYRNWQINFSKRGFNKGEPILLPIERPTLMKSILNLYNNDLNYQREDILRLMNLNEADYTNFFVDKRIINMYG